MLELCGAGYNQDLGFLHKYEEWRKEQESWVCVCQEIIKRQVLVSMEKAMAPHSSTLAWKIPWMEEPGRL